MPGHAAGLLPLQARGVEFCNAPGVSAIPNWCTMQGGNGSVAQRVLPALVHEMAELFDSELYHIGGDETRCGGAGDFERHIIGTVEAGSRRAVAWSEVGGKGSAGDGAASPETVIQTWRSPNASSMAALGAYAAIEAQPFRFYLSGGGFSCTTAKHCATKQWVDLWQDSSLPVSDPRRKLLLGGEVALWTDQYCYINDCVRPGDGHAAPAVMWNRSRDSEFGRSVGGMVWPRGHLAAGSFWHWVPGLNTTQLNATVLTRHNRMIERRGGLVCPTGCACTPLAACGVDYVPVAPSPPRPPRPHPPPPSPHPPAPPSPHSTCNFTEHVNLGRPGKKVGHASKIKSVQECCDACGRDEKCKAAHVAADGTGTCWLWSSYDPRPGNGTACVPLRGAGAAAAHGNGDGLDVLKSDDIPPGRYNVTARKSKLHGLKAGDSVRVSVPDAPGPFPLIVFLHGADDNDYHGLQANLAAYGFVVVAPLGCMPYCEPNHQWAADQLRVISLVNSSTADPAYRKANTSNVGIMGHSMGGIATVTNTRTTDPRVRAAFALHPCPKAKAGVVRIPAAFVTGSKDTTCSQHEVFEYYAAASNTTPHPPDPPLYFANMKGLGHMDGQNAWTTHVGEFFRCYLLGDAHGCSFLEQQTGPRAAAANETLCSFRPMALDKGTRQCFTPHHPCDPAQGMACTGKMM